jgi:mono/diheme cytochrome c family protein
MTGHQKLSPSMLSVVGLLCGCLLATGCGHETESADSTLEKIDSWMPGKPYRSGRVRTFAEEDSSTIIYQTSCAGCHGDNGTLGPAPPINDPLFLSIFTNEQMLDLLAHGRPGSLMPSFAAVHRSGLTEQQRQILVSSIRDRWGQSESLPENPPPYLAKTTGTVAAGRQKFALYCAECHGNEGQGGEGGEGGRINDPAFLALVSDQLMRRIMITGRVDLGMPDFVGIGARSEQAVPLSGQDISDIVALLQQWRTAPARQLQKEEQKQANAGESGSGSSLTARDN